MSGHFRHLIVSPEQLSTCNGHLPCLARLIREDKNGFTRSIGRVHIDEAHMIYSAGLARHGEDPFRPAYSRLGSGFRVFLHKVPFQVLSATLPAHVIDVVEHELMVGSQHLTLRLSTNRPNITFATRMLIDGSRNFYNLSCLVPPKFTATTVIPKTLVFHDNKLEATNATNFVNALLPKELQSCGIAKHYHSDMSIQYLQQTFDDFASDSGTCRILHATAGASTICPRMRGMKSC